MPKLVRELVRKIKVRTGLLMLGAVAVCGLWRPHLHMEAARGEGAHETRKDWPVYGGSASQDRYSSLRQINRNNVHKLRVAWTFDTAEQGGLQTNPLVIGHVLFGYTPTQKVFALDAGTGKRLWTFETGQPGLQPTRGLTYWTDGSRKILFAGLLSYLYALDPDTGRPIASFGDGGRVDLRNGLGASEPTQGFAAMTSPGAIYKDLIIVGFRLPETKPALRGDIRAYDVNTGALRWSFHTVPHPGEEGHETWPAESWRYTGSANNWCGMSVDVERGIVYVPTGSAVDDFYGGDRIGNNLFADSLLALDANTGKRLWHFQGVHHDVWDRDFPSPPTLVTVQSHGKPVDAVAQTSKQGFVYLFDRAKGNPLFPIVERPFASSTAPGEKTAPTQPMPLAPEPFARQRLTEEMLTTRTPEAHAYALKEFRTFRSDGQFVPLAVDKQTVVFPGFDGGAEWGGSAVDVRTGVLYVNANDVPWTGGLTENKPGAGPGADLYLTQCAVCHGGDRQGSPPALPSLVGVHTRLTDAQIASVVHNGKGRMPSFANVQGPRLAALVAYLKAGKDAAGDALTVPASPDHKETAGARVYAANCALCHGEDLLGEPSNYPGLVGVRLRLTDARILATIHAGKGRMPAIRTLTTEEGAALLRFLGQPSAAMAKAESVDTGIKQDVESEAASPEMRSRYRFTGYRKFYDQDGYPAVVPPWGTLSAIDLNTGKYLWKVPLGNYPELAARGLPDTGSENYGGPIVTAGGVLFIGATIFDHTFRAFDSSTGKLLWSANLPYAGNATPATYMVDGKQYVVIATSNARNPKAPQGAAYVAFALP